MTVDLFDSEVARRLFTAELQAQLEGSVIAFRGSLLDVVRTTALDGSYEVIIGDPFLGGTIVTLNIGERDGAVLGAMLRAPHAIVITCSTGRDHRFHAS